MASIGHLAAGAAASRLFTDHRTNQRSGAVFLFFVGLSFLPDADVIAFFFGIPYGDDFGHRGATHSIAFALIVGFVTWAVRDDRRLAVAAALVTVSHPLLDALTDGGYGVALFWPLSSARVFFFWRPIPVAPIGGGFLSAAGARVAMTEVLFFSPLFLYAAWSFLRRKRSSALALK